jgi:hypothetical protein
VTFPRYLMRRGRDINNNVGAQGIPVIKSLLSTDNNAQSPYAVRVLTRDPSNSRSQDLKALGCDVVKGMYLFGSCTDTITHAILDRLPQRSSLSPGSAPRRLRSVRQYRRLHHWREGGNICGIEDI